MENQDQTPPDPQRQIAIDVGATGVYEVIDIRPTWEGRFPREFRRDGQRFERVGEHDGCVAYRVSVF